MITFTCRNCGNILHFENTVCLGCGHQVGFNPSAMLMVTLQPAVNGFFASTSNKRKTYRYCLNANLRACNWLLPTNAQENYCLACSLNRVVPHLGTHRNMERWRQLEKAKHRLVYSLLRLRLPFEANVSNIKNRLAFDFLEDTPETGRVLTGHHNGVITINIEEADEVQRTRNKAWLGEGYRTLLGHFRHESGHFYWDVLVWGNQSALYKFRKLFGDERQDYVAQLKAYYATGAKTGWGAAYISAYATAHPWEDWAETWAHYMHIMDILETAHVYGIRTKRPNGRPGTTVDPFTTGDFTSIVGSFISITLAANSLNNAMGHGDFYPFHLPKPVIDKLAFIHGLVTGYELLQWATDYGGKKGGWK